MTQGAYPYATAAFEYATEHQQVAHWAKMLHWLAQLTKQTIVKQLLNNPRCEAMTAAEIIIQLGQGTLDEAANSFIKLLAENRRLLWLEAIATLFAKFQAEQEKTLVTQVVTVIALTESQRSQLTKQLERQFNRRIQLVEKLDRTIVGGFVIHVGDKVIDYSVRGQLGRLKQQLKA